MTCQEFWDSMPELAPDGAPELGEHLRGCPACVAVLARQRQVAAGLRGLAAESRRVQAPARLEGRLMAAFRGEGGMTEIPLRARWWSPVAAWVAAAALITAAALLSLRSREAQPLPATAPQMAAVDWTFGLAIEDAGGGTEEGEFIALPNAEQLPPPAQVNMVRVELPRSAMISLGYDVKAEEAGEMVEADIVLGSDGLARAVRFLN